MKWREEEVCFILEKRWMGEFDDLSESKGEFVV
jgi:hypothetical protein